MTSVFRMFQQREGSYSFNLFIWTCFYRLAGRGSSTSFFSHSPGVLRPWGPLSDAEVLLQQYGVVDIRGTSLSLSLQRNL
jgi:hypothetical protein